MLIVDVCNSSPCHNGAKCRELHAGFAYICDCKTSATVLYTGIHCEKGGHLFNKIERLYSQNNLDVYFKHCTNPHDCSQIFIHV